MSNRREFLKIKNLKQLEKKIEKDIQNVLYRKQTAKGISQIVVDDIQDGKSFQASKATQAIRKVLERLNKTSPKYTREKINFTFTGELLNDLIKNVKRFRFGKRTVFNIGHSNKMHRAYRKKGAKKKRSGKGVKQVPYNTIYENLKRLDNRYRYLKRPFKKTTSRKIVRFIKKSIVSFYTKK